MHLVGVLLDILDGLQDTQSLLHAAPERQIIDGGMLDDSLCNSQTFYDPQYSTRILPHQYAPQVRQAPHAQQQLVFHVIHGQVLQYFITKANRLAAIGQCFLLAAYAEPSSFLTFSIISYMAETTEHYH